MSARILVVDDSLVLRTMARMTLEDAGFAVSEAEDGVEALVMLERQEAPALILLDMNMPRMNGIELLQHILQDGPHGVPVLVVTSHTEAALVSRAKRLGAKAYIVKPFQPDMLLAAVRMLTAEDSLRSVRS